MDNYFLILIFFAGILTGFINTLAGSGSLISLPLLIYTGLPAPIANGTNRIGIMLQSIVAIITLNKSKLYDWKSSWDLIIPAIVGGITGAFLAVDFNKETMEFIVGGLLLFMIGLMILNPEKWIKEQADKTKGLSIWIRIIIFFFIGIYGGFIQAGVGFFLLAGLVLGAGYNLAKANALKIVITGFFTLFALPVFIFNNQIAWIPGIVLAFGSSIGAFVAAKLAIKKGSSFIRYFLLVILILASFKLLQLDKLLF